jgi:hypothetical protein
MARAARRAGRFPTRRHRPPQSGRDLSQTAIWAGIVAASEMIPAQIDHGHAITRMRGP